MAKNIEEAVEAIVQEIVQDSNLEVVDVEYVKERDWYLRVYLDKEGGIEIDDCQRVSETLEQILDEKDLLTEAYILEVSSPGLDRVLKKARDFEREQGKAVDVTVNDRGPYVAGRCLDLTTGAFQAIADTRQGVAKVSYEIIS